MYAERKTIDQVRQHLRRGAPKLTPELADVAEQFAALVARVNRRLEDCAAFLARGLRTEARHVAEAEPPLLDLARILLADEFHAWQGFCAANALAEPVPVSPELVEMLSFAVGGSGAGSPERDRLMALHRRVSQIGTYRERIRVLRLVRTIDSGNDFWREDLALLETFRLREIPGELETAFRAGDEARLQDLRIEVYAREWIAPPPERLKDAVADRHRTIRRRHLEVRAGEIARAASEAHAALDLEGVRAALADWAHEAADPDFPRDLPVAVQVAEASSWLAAEDRRLAAEHEHHGRIDALVAILERAGEPEEIGPALDAIAASGREVPAEIEQRARARIEEVHRARRLRFQLRAGGIAAAALAVVAALVTGAVLLSRSAARADWLERIDAAIEAEAWSEASALLESYEREHPGLAAEPEALERLDRVAEALATVAARKEAFQTLVARVEAMRRDGFEPFPETWRVLQEAQPLATDDEDREIHARLRREVDEAERARQAAIDRRFEEALAAVRAEVDGLARIDPARQPDLYRRSLEEATRRLEPVRADDQASERAREGLPRLESDLAAARRRLAEAIRARQERASQLEAVDSSLPDLEAFERAVRVASTRPDLPEETLRELRALRERCGLYAAAARRFPGPFSDDAAGRERLEATLRTLGTRSDPWKETLLALQAAFRWHDRVEAARTSIRDLRSIRIYHDLYSFRPARTRMRNSREVYYFFDPPAQTSKVNDAFGFSGPMVNEAFGLETTTFYHGSARIEPVRTPHAEYVRGLLLRLERQPSSDFAEFAWREARDVAARKDLEPAVAMVFVRRLLAAFADPDDPLLEPFRRLEEDWRHFDSPVAWLGDHPEARDASKKRRAALDALPDLSGALIRWQLRRDLDLAAIGRGIEVAGQVRTGPERRWGVTFRSHPEYWVVRPGLDDPASGLRFLVVARRIGGELVLDERLAAELQEGEPLFAPADGLATPDLLARLATARGLDPATLHDWSHWPAAWPENARTFAPSERE